MSSKSHLVASTTILLLVSVSSVFAIEYEIIDLGNLGTSRSEAKAINDNGQIVGHSQTSDGYYHAFIWEDGIMTDLGTLDISSGYEENSSAVGVNENGQVVGVSHPEMSGGNHHAFMYQNGSMNDLGYIGSGSVTSINNDAKIVGRNEHGKAFVYTDGQFLELGIDVIYDHSEATAINNNGLITGMVSQEVGLKWLNKCFIAEPPTSWSGSTITYFGDSDKHPHAYGINDDGQITGHIDGQVFLYQDGKMIDLGINGNAWDINNHGMIVGKQNSTDCAFIYDNGVITDLGALPGHKYSKAFAINDNGWVVGRSSVGDGHSWNAVLWKPIPEPTTLLLLSLGVVMLRRKRFV